ncbi:hypothetical protein CC2G_001145 [Coprinopsis cinerea AmutBmut pab1-1]|nr:hypothetical protein CC2G_001145 [Coprinopsis cinerea AmutBmut pab1-1]
MTVLTDLPDDFACRLAWAGNSYCIELLYAKLNPFHIHSGKGAVDKRKVRPAHSSSDPTPCHIFDSVIWNTGFFYLSTTVLKDSEPKLSDLFCAWFMLWKRSFRSTESTHKK